MSATPIIVTSFALLLLGGVGLGFTEMRLQALEDHHLPWVVGGALVLAAALVPFGLRSRAALVAEKMAWVTVIAGAVGCVVTSAFVCRLANGLLAPGEALESRAAVADRRGGGNRRRVLTVRLGPSEAFPEGVSVRVDDAIFEGATTGRIARLRYHRGALGSRWCGPDPLRFE